MNFARVLWYARRARTMERGELRARLTRAVGGAADYVHWWLRGQSAFRRDLESRRFAFCASEKAVLPELPWKFAVSGEELASLLAGRHHALGYPWEWRADGDVWHRAPDTGRHWPRAFSDLIDHRPGNTVGDARVVWEPNRLQQLVDLALVTRLMPQHAGAAARMLRQQLLSWLDSNPVRIGVNYSSAMECALRILSVCVASDLARPALRDDGSYWKAVATLVLEHADFVNAKLSLYSSLGNHTIAECVGLYVAALAFPEVSGAPAWEARARDVLERAALREIMEDGGPAEQALHYHAQVLDLLEIALRIGRRFGRTLENIDILHRRGVKFLARFECDRHHLPRIGDDDDGYALSRFFASAWSRHPGSGAAVDPHVPIATWSGGGYTIVRAADAGLVLCHAPLGMAPNFGHGHADALALTLCIVGETVLIDPGTYAYGAQSRWRTYFRSTAAHNTVEVDGQSQAREKGAFLWEAPYACDLTHVSGDGQSANLIARHDGYERLGVHHIRAIRMNGRTITVIDRLEGDGEHELMLRWHFAAPADQMDGAYVLAGIHGFRCLASGGIPSLLSASVDPPGGWVSTRYGDMTPATTLTLRRGGPLPHEFVTHFVLPRGDVGALGDAERALRDLMDAPGGARSRETESVPA